MLFFDNKIKPKAKERQRKMKKLRMMVTSLAAIAMLAVSALQMQGQTEETDANGTPMKLYPDGFFDSGTQAKNSLKGKLSALRRILLQGITLIGHSRLTASEHSRWILAKEE
jgi:hypothetical protein